MSNESAILASDEIWSVLLGKPNLFRHWKLSLKIPCDFSGQLYFNKFGLSDKFKNRSLGAKAFLFLKSFLFLSGIIFYSEKAIAGEITPDPTHFKEIKQIIIEEKINEFPIVEGIKADWGLKKTLIEAPLTLLLNRRAFKDFLPYYGYSFPAIKNTDVCDYLADYNMGQVYFFTSKNNDPERLIGIQLSPDIINDISIEQIQTSSTTANSKFSIAQLCKLLNDDIVMDEINRKMLLLSEQDEYPLWLVTKELLIINVYYEIRVSLISDD